MVQVFYDFHSWKCTDADQLQYCKKETDHEFYYLQVKPQVAEKIEKLFGVPFSGCDEQVKEYIYRELNENDVWWDLIDTDCYTPQEKEEYIEPYGGILDGSLGDECIVNQLTAECIFETDYVMSND